MILETVVSALPRVNVRKARRMLPILGASSLLLASACQIIAPQPQAQPQPQLFADRSGGLGSANGSSAGAASTTNSAPGVASSSGSSALVPMPSQSQIDSTYTLIRGTIRDSVTVAGKVAPARSAQLNFPSGGTVTAVFVHSGQAVKQDEPLAELQLSPENLQIAQRQALLAQLTYESQAAKVKDLQDGARPGVVADAEAALTRAQAAQREAEIKAGAGSATPADEAVGLAQLDVEQAQRDVDQASVVRDQTLSTESVSASDRVSVASASTRLAARALAEASSKLDQLQNGQDKTRANLEQQARVAEVDLQQAKNDLQVAKDAEQRARKQIPADMQRAVRLAELDLQESHRALRQAQETDDYFSQERATTARTQDQINRDLLQADWAVQAGKNTVSSQTVKLEQAKAALVSTPEQAIATAVAVVQSAASRVDNASLRLDQARAAIGAVADQDAIQQAQSAVDQARDTLSQARAAEARARSDQNGLAPDPSEDATVNPSVATQDALVAGAQGRLNAAMLKLNQTRAAQVAANRANGVQSQSDNIEVNARRAETAAAQARLNDVQAGISADAISREERLAGLMRDEADQARKAAQAVVTLKAPFDGIVTAAAVSPGQAIEARATVIRFAGNDGLTVVATASEAEVSQLSADQSVDVNFPNLPNLTTSGTIVDISGVGSVADGGKGTTYPVRVDLATAPSQLKIGMSALVSLSLREAVDVLHLPSSTIRQVNGKSVVSRLETDGRVTDIPVQVGGAYGTEVEITGGLREGDVVAVFRPGGSTTAAAKQ